MARAFVETQDEPKTLPYKKPKNNGMRKKADKIIQKIFMPRLGSRKPFAGLICQHSF